MSALFYNPHNCRSTPAGETPPYSMWPGVVRTKEDIIAWQHPRGEDGTVFVTIEDETGPEDDACFSEWAMSRSST